MRRRKSQVRVGIISDVHADIRSLRDALSHLEKLDCSSVLCAGDLIDWAASPEQTVALLRESRIPCVRGNHDFVDVDGRDEDGRLLSDGAILFLDSLPATWAQTIAGIRVAMCHARPGDMMRGIHPDAADAAHLLADADADVLIVGHTHVPMHVTVGKRCILNAGSVLRDTEPAAERIVASATFGVLELPSRQFRVHRTADGRETQVTATCSLVGRNGV